MVQSAGTEVFKQSYFNYLDYYFTIGVFPMI